MVYGTALVGWCIAGGYLPLYEALYPLSTGGIGAAFSWAIPMAFGAVLGYVPLEAWLLFFANVLWTVAYDTQYAMVDRDDDLKIGIKSTAVLFGNADCLMIGLLQVATLGLLGWVGWRVGLGGFSGWGLPPWQPPFCTSSA
ncbi:hypothetical protein HSBAA_65890 [Vreelandella sulfidaeris]|uniref:4-hydroxybenzoate polyprenyltransferase n=1 Tax=Vreelandella sulfidaeris TaxID=115553 RepID=A0A455UIP9_9GAMM|nr:hypothetical protein HSBAA_65890 [Halomonas sulfidaeris]